MSRLCLEFVNDDLRQPRLYCFKPGERLWMGQRASIAL